MAILNLNKFVTQLCFDRLSPTERTIFASRVFACARRIPRRSSTALIFNYSGPEASLVGSES